MWWQPRVPDEGDFALRAAREGVVLAVAGETEPLVERVRSREGCLEVAHRPGLIGRVQNRSEKRSSDASVLDFRLDSEEGEIPVSLGRVLSFERSEAFEQSLRSDREHRVNCPPAPCGAYQRRCVRLGRLRW